VGIITISQTATLKKALPYYKRNKDAIIFWK